MDHWGDPWADNADNAKTPTKSEVTTPLPPTFAPAQTLLNGFLDDAGWGNDEESFGDWSPAPAQLEEAVHTGPTDSCRLDNLAHGSDELGWPGEDRKEEETSHSTDDWAALRLDAPMDDEKVVSETSDSSTTIQPENGQEDAPTHASPRATPDDVSSTPASTSPSETSHNDVIESPRTSYEEERGTAKAMSILERDQGPVKLGLAAPNVERPAISSVPEALPSRSAGTSVIDQDLLRELFVPAQFKELDEAPDSPIYSTSSRKAWYRLTRRQTMREYNNGNDDDNYIRVTWANSNVRSEVDKIVGRWAREDRLSGRGPGARASFYWDTPAPTDSRPASMHARRQSSHLVSNGTAPIQGGPPPLSTNAQAAFNWSSPSTSTNPWHQGDSTPIATIPPIVPSQPDALKLQGSDSQVGNTDPTLRKPNAANGMQTGSAADETTAAASLISPAPSTPKEQLVDAPVDDDDWGEMISTPTLTTSKITLANLPTSTPATPPHLVRSTSLENDSPDTMHAAPIVRLKSTISPTSTLFKANSFVPLGVEQGPIGPGILKSSRRLASLNSEKTADKQPLAAQPTPEVAPKETVTSSMFASDDFAAWQSPDLYTSREGTSQNSTSPAVDSSTAQQSPCPSTPSQAAAPAESGHDAWADTDFSFFESALPVSTPRQVKQDSSDLPSKFESPPRSSSSASSAKTFTRSPPRKVTPPPLQPLTGATSSAQRRKNEEDHIIHDILKGLPDLSYMLR